MDDVVNEVPEGNFFPRSRIKELLTKYPPDDVTLILADFVDLRETTFANAQKKKVYLVTAGGPASGKSTLIEGVLKGTHPTPQYFTHNTSYCYIDPDRTVLQHMTHAQVKDQICDRSAEASYTKWREASQFIANVLLAIALKEGHQVSIIHLTTSLGVRTASLQAREAAGTIQSTPEDFINKQAMFLNLLPHYLKYPINFAYRGAMDHVVWAADMAPDQKEPRILDAAAFHEIATLHNSSNGNPAFWNTHFATRAASFDINLLNKKV